MPGGLLVTFPLPVPSFVTIRVCIGTVSVALPDTPSTVAVMVAAPGPIAVARPVAGLTAATEALLVLHVTDRPSSAFPLAPRGIAENCCVALRRRFGVAFAKEGRIHRGRSQARFRLGIEALRLGLAYEYDPYFSLSIARVDPLPHQLEAVYDYFLRLPRIRFLLADDPGAGKTIMAGLLSRN
jgi:hypothetical protein